MQVIETLAEGLKREIKVVIPAKDMEQRMNERLADVKDKVRINGFRPGKVPASHVKKMYGKSIMAELVNEIIRDKPGAILSERGEKSATQPEIVMTEDEKEAEKILSAQADLEFTLSYEIIPAIELKPTAGIKVVREVVDVPEEEVNEQIMKIAENVHLDGVELDYVYQERRPKNIPIYIGATGMQMMELTGEIADGVVLNYLVSPDYNKQAIEALGAGAAKANRNIEDIDRPQLVVCSVHEDRQIALNMAREMVTQYLGQQPHIMKASGVPQSLLDKVGEVLTWPATHEQVTAASKLVPDEVVQMLTASGTPQEARKQVLHYIENGATCPILYPLGDVKAMIDTFSDWDGVS